MFVRILIADSVAACILAVCGDPATALPAPRRRAHGRPLAERRARSAGARARCARPAPRHSPRPRSGTPARRRRAARRESAAYVRRLQELLKRWEPYVNTTRYSTPVYTVPADQPTVRVTLDNDAASTSRRRSSACRSRAAPAPPTGSDRHMVVWQPSTDTMWEFWVARRLCDGWHARYGGRMTNVSTQPGPLHTDPLPARVGRHRHEPAAARRPDAPRRARGRPDRPRARDRAARDPGGRLLVARAAHRRRRRTTRTRSRRARASASTRRST